MSVALVGVAIGVASAYGLTRVIASFLFGVTARDPGVCRGAAAAQQRRAARRVAARPARGTRRSGRRPANGLGRDLLEA